MKRLALLLIAGIALLVPAACNFGTAPGGTEGEGLTGVLVNPSGAPTARATVRLYPVESGALAKGHAVAVTDSTPDSVRTGGGGRFLFQNLTPGATYNLAASITRNDTVYSVFIANIVYTGGRLDIGQTSLKVSGGLTLSIELGGTLSTDSVVCRVAGSPYLTTSNSSGECVLKGLPPGSFTIEISRPGYRTIVTDALQVIQGTIVAGGIRRLDAVTKPLPPVGQHFEVQSSTLGLWTFSQYASGTSSLDFADLSPRHAKLTTTTRIPLTAAPADSAADFSGSGTRLLTALPDSVYDPARSGWLTIEGRVFLTAYPASTNAGQRAMLAGIEDGPRLMIGADGSLQVTGLKSSTTETPSTPLPRTVAGVVPLGRWVDLGMTIDINANQMYAFVNGQPFQLTWPAGNYARLSGSKFANKPLVVGNATVANQPFRGVLDELRVSNFPTLGLGIPMAFNSTRIDTISVDTVAAPTPDARLVAWYTFEEGSGTTLQDRTGKGHTGTIQSGTWVSGIQGTGLEFNGSSTRVTVPFKADLNLSEFTLSAWIRSTRTAGQALISRQTASGSSAPWNYRLATTEAATYGTLVVPSGSLLVDFNPADLSLNTSPISKASVVDGVWHQVTGVYGGGVLKVYIDGVLDTIAAPTDIPDLTSIEPLLLGASAFSGGAYFKGTMDEVRIYNKALTSPQIDSLYRAYASAGMTSVVASADGCVAGPMPGYADNNNILNSNGGADVVISSGAYDVYGGGRALVRFNIPAGYTSQNISKAILRLNVAKWNIRNVHTPYRMDVRKLLKSWKEGTGVGSASINSATVDGITGRERFWGSQDGSEDWSEVLIGIKDNDASSTVTATLTKAPGATEAWEFDVTALARNWADAPASNFGVVFTTDFPATNAEVHDYPDFHSKEAPVADSLKPTLILNGP